MDKIDLEQENTALRNEIDRLSQDLAKQRKMNQMLSHQRNQAQDNVAELAAALAVVQDNTNPLAVSV